MKKIIKKEYVLNLAIVFPIVFTLSFIYYKIYSITSHLVIFSLLISVEWSIVHFIFLKNFKKLKNKKEKILTTLFYFVFIIINLIGYIFNKINLITSLNTEHGSSISFVPIFISLICILMYYIIKIIFKFTKKRD